MKDFEEIISEHQAILYKIGRVYATAEDFDDLYQEMLIAIWKSLDSFKGQSKVSTWIYRVALNTALSYHKVNNRRQTAMDSFSQEQAHIYTDHAEDERTEKLYRAIRQLAKDERSLILLYLDENSYEEIAQIIGISMSNVGVRINRIKKKLLRLLNHQPS
ncbi:MAG: RNA polymerase sigma factor [Cyclobacteriaceae bacterium]